MRMSANLFKSDILKHKVISLLDVLDGSIGNVNILFNISDSKNKNDIIEVRPENHDNYNTSGNYKFSGYGAYKFTEVLSAIVLDINEDTNLSNTIIITLRKPSYLSCREFIDKIEEFLNVCAGECDSCEFDKIYSLGVYKNCSIYDTYDIQLKIKKLYNIDIDINILIIYQNVITNMIENNTYKENFIKEYSNFFEDVTKMIKYRFNVNIDADMAGIPEVYNFLSSSSIDKNMSQTEFEEKFNKLTESLFNK